MTIKKNFRKGKHPNYVLVLRLIPLPKKFSAHRRYLAAREDAVGKLCKVKNAVVGWNGWWYARLQDHTGRDIVFHKDEVEHGKKHRRKGRVSFRLDRLPNE